MPDTVDIQYAGRRLRADLVTFVASAEAARLFNSQLDTDGNMVPVWKAHTFTYYGAGQVHSDTVSDGTSTWVRIFGYENGQQISDSGWVKQ